jgi:hypothetical protein
MKISVTLTTLYENIAGKAKTNKLSTALYAVSLDNCAFSITTMK